MMNLFGLTVTCVVDSHWCWCGHWRSGVDVACKRVSVVLFSVWAHQHNKDNQLIKKNYNITILIYLLHKLN